MTRSLAQRRYIKRMLGVTAAYLTSVALASIFIDKGAPVTALTVLLAVLPGLAVIGFFLVIGRLIVEEQDEFVKMLIIRQSLIATGFALSIASAWGFLEAYGVAPHIDSYWVAILWFFGLGVGAVANKLQYGAYGECY
ncbi:MAG TPA: hypothetical protein VFU80_02015 [Sphingomicrobium sp.]|nr:hypothetical protein [Sphingomicrobium sp.]